MMAAFVAVPPVDVVQTLAPLRAQTTMMMHIGLDDLGLAAAQIGHVHGSGASRRVAENHPTTRRADEFVVIPAEIALMKNVQ